MKIALLFSQFLATDKISVECKLRMKKRTTSFSYIWCQSGVRSYPPMSSNLGYPKMLIKSKRIIVQTLFLVSIQHLISSFENENKNYEIKYVNAILFCFSFVLNFSIVFIKIELNEFWWFFVRKDCYFGNIRWLYF